MTAFDTIDIRNIGLRMVNINKTLKTHNPINLLKEKMYFLFLTYDTDITGGGVNRATVPGTKGGVRG